MVPNSVSLENLRLVPIYPCMAKRGSASGVIIYSTATSCMCEWIERERESPACCMAEHVPYTPDL